MNDNTSLPYRRGVGIALFNTTGHIFVGERIDSPGAWQMPQGGIDSGETAEDAFFREMKEEIGTDLADILRILNQPLRYDLPPHLQKDLWGGKFRGQEQIWIAARFTGTDADINLNAHTPAEFNRWQWVEPDQLVNLIVPFKRDIYARVIEEFKNIALR